MPRDYATRSWKPEGGTFIDHILHTKNLEQQSGGSHSGPERLLISDHKFIFASFNVGIPTSTAADTAVPKVRRAELNIRNEDACNALRELTDIITDRHKVNLAPTLAEHDAYAEELCRETANVSRKLMKKPRLNHRRKDGWSPTSMVLLAQLRCFMEISRKLSGTGRRVQ